MDDKNIGEGEWKPAGLSLGIGVIFTGKFSSQDTLLYAETQPFLPCHYHKFADSSPALVFGVLCKTGLIWVRHGEQLRERK